MKEAEKNDYILQRFAVNLMISLVFAVLLFLGVVIFQILFVSSEAEFTAASFSDTTDITSNLEYKDGCVLVYVGNSPSRAQNSEFCGTTTQILSQALESAYSVRESKDQLVIFSIGSGLYASGASQTQLKLQDNTWIIGSGMDTTEINYNSNATFFTQERNEIKNIQIKNLAFNIASSQIVAADFTYQTTTPAFLKISLGQDIIISGNKIIFNGNTGNFYDFALSLSGNNIEVSDNQISGLQYQSVASEARDRNSANKYAVAINNPANKISINNNILSENERGILIKGDELETRNSITDFVFAGEIQGNTISEADLGIYLFKARDFLTFNNKISSVEGIVLADSLENEIYANTIDASSTGITLSTIANSPLGTQSNVIGVLDSQPVSATPATFRRVGNLISAPIAVKINSSIYPILNNTISYNDLSNSASCEISALLDSSNSIKLNSNAACEKV